MLTNRLTGKVYRCITVSPTAVSYEKTIGRRRPVRGLMSQGTKINFVRLLIERKEGRGLPDLYLVARRLHELKGYADFESRDYLSVARNNRGEYLLEVPILPANIRVCERFLEWMDDAMTKEGNSCPKQ